MEIHNCTEDIVLESVNEIFDEVERQRKEGRPCTCFQCRLDTACYVLNRSAPRYVVSSRGAARAEGEALERQQLKADIVSLVWEGWNKISKSMRPHFQHDNAASKAPPAPLSGPTFNIPTILGRIFNGLNFEPVSDMEIALHSDGEPAKMMDANWQNPFRLVPNTAGTFTFWPRCVPAAAVGEERRFAFTVIARASGFEDLRHFFEIAVTAEREPTASFSTQRTHKLPDLYVFPPGGEEDQ